MDDAHSRKNRNLISSIPKIKLIGTYDTNPIINVLYGRFENFSEPIIS